MQHSAVLTTALACGLFLYSMCATVAANFELNQVFDKLIISLCKFTTLLTPPEVDIYIQYIIPGDYEPPEGRNTQHAVLAEMPLTTHPL